MKESFGTEQSFQASSILAAISVPLLAAVSTVEILANNTLLIRTVAIAGFLFLIAALLSFLELIEISRVPDMTVADAFHEFLSSRGALLLGLLWLLVFQIVQSRSLF